MSLRLWLTVATGTKKVRNLLLGALVSCAGKDPVAPPHLTTVDISPAVKVMFLDQTVGLIGTPRDQYGQTIGTSVQWSTSDPDIATVDAQGVVTAIGQGRATITATVEGTSGAAPITVHPDYKEVWGLHLATCARNHLNNVYCWGYGVEKNPGDFCSNSVCAWPTPIPVFGSTTVRAAAAWGTGICALSAENREVCRTVQSPSFVYPFEPARYESRSMGEALTCGTPPGSGIVYCHGANNSGELGRAFRSSEGYPYGPVSSSIPFHGVSVGSSHVCALTAGGDAYCWGASSSGAVGVDSSAACGSPCAFTIPTRVQGTNTFTSLGAGEVHTCGLHTDGRVLCWGTNTAYSLGRDVPSATVQATPTEIAGGWRFNALRTWHTHSCAITTDDKVVCWGIAQYGALPTIIAGLPVVTGIGVGRDHACALAVSGRLYCWGSNSLGQSGQGFSVTPNLGPMRVPRPL